jgi:hypothetical protein
MGKSMEAIFLSPWFTLIAGLVGGVIAHPTMISPLLGRLFPTLPGGVPKVLPAADAALVYFQQIVQLLHKVLDQHSPNPPPPPPPTDLAAQLLEELKKLLQGQGPTGSQMTPGV